MGKLAAFSGYLLVFLMLVFPFVPSLLYPKILLVSVIFVAISITTLKTGDFALCAPIALWSYALCALGFLFVLKGFTGGAPGTIQVLPLYVIWPIIYCLMIAAVRNERILFGLMKTFIVATICIGVYSIGYTLTQTKILPENTFLNVIYFDWTQEEFFLTNGLFHMQYPGLDSLPFLVPFTFASFVTFSSKAGKPLLAREFWLFIAVFLSLVSVLLSGRRALFLVTLTAPLMTLLFTSFQPVPERTISKKRLARAAVFAALALVIGLTGLNAIYDATLEAIIDRFSAGFTFEAGTVDVGAAYRREQYHALIEGWMENPMFGAGHGAPAEGSIRSQLNSGNYELYYLALLYQTGLVGFTAYVAGVLWIYWIGFKIIRAGGPLARMMVASLAGMSSILIANATNPYLQGFEKLWAIFLPLSIINVWMMQRKHRASILTSVKEMNTITSTPF